MKRIGCLRRVFGSEIAGVNPCMEWSLLVDESYGRMEGRGRVIAGTYGFFGRGEAY